jgi:hypothetical protein
MGSMGGYGSMGGLGGLMRGIRTGSQQRKVSKQSAKLNRTYAKAMRNGFISPSESRKIGKESMKLAQMQQKLTMMQTQGAGLNQYRF